ncbi:unnamed protein product [Ectocarpus sp. 13 AM-2016]
MLTVKPGQHGSTYGKLTPVFPQPLVCGYSVPFFGPKRYCSSMHEHQRVPYPLLAAALNFGYGEQSRLLVLFRYRDEKEQRLGGHHYWCHLRTHTVNPSVCHVFGGV